jgi:hypothetical protein
LKLKQRERHQMYTLWTRRLFVAQKEYRTVAGHQIALDKKTVQHKLATIKPEKNASVYVKVGKKDFPVKQAFAEATGLIRSQFSTKDAVRVLEWAGYEAKQREKRKANDKP